MRLSDPDEIENEHKLDVPHAMRQLNWIIVGYCVACAGLFGWFIWANWF
jgi:hypothetical protein